MDDTNRPADDTNRPADDENRSTLVIRIGPTDRPAGEIAAAIDATDAVSADALPGELDAGETVRQVDDEDDVDRLLSDGVQAVLKAITERAPESIEDLADGLDRPNEAVEEDVEFLADLRIVSLRTGGPEGQVTERPTFPYGSLEYEAVLRPPGTGQ